MKSIWKFPLQVADQQLVEMPLGAHILSVQMQGTQPCLWALVDTNAKKVAHTVQLFGTGHTVEDEGTYIGTFQMHDGALVFHAFIK